MVFYRVGSNSIIDNNKMPLWKNKCMLEKKCKNLVFNKDKHIENSKFDAFGKMKK